MMKVTVFLLSD